MLHKLTNLNIKLNYQFILFTLFIFSSPLSAETIKIGVRSINSIEFTTAQWKATSDYLTETIEGYTFELVPDRSITALSNRLGNNEFEFVILTPSSYIEIEKKYGASRLLTLQNKRHGKPYTVFGSVIFTKKERDDINNLEDLYGKTLMVNSPHGFGGWMVAWGELLEHNIDPKTDLKKILFPPRRTQIEVVEAVLSGKVDAGVVRTDMLERLELKNIIDIKQVKVLGQKNTAGFPFLHSSKLYPEWTIAKAENTPNELAQKVAIALLQLKPDHTAAINGKYIGWTVALNYEPVHQLLKKLRVSPYEKLGALTLEQAIIEYKREITAALALFVISVLIILYSISVNRRLTKREQLVQNEKQILQQEIEQRNNNIILLNSIGTAQSSYINTSNEKLAFNALLNGLLEMTKGKIGSIVHLNNSETEKFQTYTTLSCVDNAACNVQTSFDLVDIYPFQEILERVAKSKNIETLIYVFSEQDNLIDEANDILFDKIFIQAIPILHKNKVVSIICLCKKSGFNSTETLKELEPLFTTCTNLITRFNDKKTAKINEQALQESESQQRTIIDSMSEALIIIEDNGEIKKCNPATMRLFGFDEDEIIRKNIDLFISNYSGIIHEYYLYKDLNDNQKKSIVLESTGRRKDESTFPLFISISEITINHRHYFAGFFRDITDLKKTSQLKREKEAAELANKSKSEFLANMSHELRTPLHGILSFSSLGLRKVESNDVESMRSFFTHIHQSGDRLLKLIDNILDLSSVESGMVKLQLNQINLALIVNQCIAEIKPLADEKTIKIDFVAPDFMVQCDQTLLYQVIVNLLSNAIKFSPENESIFVRLNEEKIMLGSQTYDAACISVSDNGVGIPKGEEKLIFDKFIQSSKTKTNAGGTGLGLSICKEFIKLHSGTITAKNRQQGGSIFTILLPIEQKFD